MGSGYGGDEDPMALLRDVIGKIRDHSYITSEIKTDGVGGCKKLQFLVTFSTLFVLTWVGWSEKIQKCTDVIYGLSLINKKASIVFSMKPQCTLNNRLYRILESWKVLELIGKFL